jgi:hypothetical protein
VRVSLGLAEEPLLHGLEERGSLTTTRRPEGVTVVLDKLWNSTLGFRVASVSAFPEAGSAVSSQIVWVPRPVAEGLTITPGKLAHTGADVGVMGAACARALSPGYFQIVCFPCPVADISTTTSIASGMGRRAPVGVKVGVGAGEDWGESGVSVVVFETVAGRTLEGSVATSVGAFRLRAEDATVGFGVLNQGFC